MISPGAEGVPGAARAEETFKLSNPFLVRKARMWEVKSTGGVGTGGQNPGFRAYSICGT